MSHLSEQKREGSEGKRPTILIGKMSLTALSAVQHFIVYA